MISHRQVDAREIQLAQKRIFECHRERDAGEDDHEVYAHSVPCHVLRGRYRILGKEKENKSSEAQLFIIVCMRYILH